MSYQDPYGPPTLPVSPPATPAYPAQPPVPAPGHPGAYAAQPGYPPAPGAYPPAGYPMQPGAPVPYGHPLQPMVIRSMKETGIAYLFWLFFGVLGAHHFYLGKTGRGLLYLFTIGGFFGIGCLIDLFTLPAQVRQVNAQRAAGVA